MKFKKLAVIASTLSLAAAANAADLSSYFTNLDFDSGVVNNGTFGFNGFDNPNTDIIGWRNRNDAPTLADSGVEGPGAWWGPYQDKAAFMKAGDGAYNLSNYVIQDGDIFSLSFFARTWDNPATGAAWTVSLFYNTPANEIGSFTQSLTGGWTQYSSSSIAAPAQSVGGTLGIMFYNTGTKFGNLDEITVSVVPEPTTMSLLAMAGLGMLLRHRRFAK